MFPLGRFAFIYVKGRDNLVWTATTLPFEAIELHSHKLKEDRRPLAEWQTVFDQLRWLDGLSD